MRSSWVLAIVFVCACGGSHHATGGTGGKAGDEPESGSGHSRGSAGRGGRADQPGVVSLADRDGGLGDGGDELVDRDASAFPGDDGSDPLVDGGVAGSGGGNAGTSGSAGDGGVAQADASPGDGGDGTGGATGGDAGAPNACGGVGALSCPAAYDGTDRSCVMGATCWPLGTGNGPNGCPEGCTSVGFGQNWFVCDAKDNTRLQCPRCKCP